MKTSFVQNMGKTLETKLGKCYMWLNKRENPGDENRSVPQEDPPESGKSSSVLLAHLPEELIFHLEGSRQGSGSA